MRLSFAVGQYDTDTVYQADLAVAHAINPQAFVRLDAVCGYIEKSAGVYDWMDLDRRVTEALARGLRAHFMVPYWPPSFRRAGAPDKTQLRDQASIDAWLAFLRALIARYDGRVEWVELGNECNIQTPFAPDGVAPLFQAHLADLAAPLFPTGWRLCTPGLAPASDNGTKSLSPLTFLTDYWHALAPSTRKRIHFVGIHPYGRVIDAGQPWSQLGHLSALHDLTGRPLLATEYNSDWNDSDAAKAANVPPALDYMRGLGFVERVFIYAVSDKSTDSSVRLGMMNADRSPRPLLGAVRTWAAAQ